MSLTDGDGRWSVPHRLAIDHRRHSELRETRRSARHVARITFSLADPHVLVRRAVGLALRALRCGDLRDWHSRRLVADRRGWALVHLPNRPGWMTLSDRRPMDT